MPIEIRELVIKATIEEKSSSGAGGGTVSPSLKQQLVQSCVDKVLDILRDKKDR